MVQEFPPRHNPIHCRQHSVLPTQITRLERAEIPTRRMVEIVEGRTFRRGRGSDVRLKGLGAVSFERIEVGSSRVTGVVVFGDGVFMNVES